MAARRPIASGQHYVLLTGVAGRRVYLSRRTRKRRRPIFSRPRPDATRRPDPADAIEGTCARHIEGGVAMRTLLVPAALAAFIATAPFAFAAQHATGTVKAFDAKAMTLTLNDNAV